MRYRCGELLVGTGVCVSQTDLDHDGFAYDRLRADYVDDGIIVDVGAHRGQVEAWYVSISDLVEIIW